MQTFAKEPAIAPAARREDERNGLGGRHASGSFRPARTRPRRTRSDAPDATTPARQAAGRYASSSLCSPAGTDTAMRARSQRRSGTARPVQPRLPARVPRARHDEQRGLRRGRLEVERLGLVARHARDRETLRGARRRERARPRRDERARLRVERRSGERLERGVVLDDRGLPGEEHAAERSRERVAQDVPGAPLEPRARQRRGKRRHDVADVHETEERLRVPARERRPEESRPPRVADRRRGGRRGEAGGERAVSREGLVPAERRFRGPRAPTQPPSQERSVRDDGKDAARGPRREVGDDAGSPLEFGGRRTRDDVARAEREGGGDAQDEKRTATFAGRRAARSARDPRRATPAAAAPNASQAASPGSRRSETENPKRTARVTAAKAAEPTRGPLRGGSASCPARAGHARRCPSRQPSRPAPAAAARAKCAKTNQRAGKRTPRASPMSHRRGTRPPRIPRASTTPATASARSAARRRGREASPAPAAPARTNGSGASASVTR